MAVTRTTETVITVASVNQSGSQNITVPSDAEICIVLVSIYKYASDWMGANPISLGGTNLTTLQKTDNTSEGMQTWCGYLLAPSTGTQSFAWSWGAAPGQQGCFVILFYKGINTSSPIKDSDKTITALADLTGLDASSGDMMVGVVASYDNSPTVTDNSQTLLYDYNYGSSDGGFAQKDGGTGFYFSNGQYTTVAACVIAQAAAAGLSIPVAMYHYTHH
jgi:hypothetical protein